ncbi:MAG: hypothetical protein JWQ35_2215, partial [Bacteriovoracaceae bacterium]|nr:hypothetical protein [Bacteriovoracaceae bacterium]
MGRVRWVNFFVFIGILVGSVQLLSASPNPSDPLQMANLAGVKLSPATDILGEYLNPYFSISHDTHEVIIINERSAALENRLRLIENAKDHLLIESFRFSKNNESRAILSALVKKAESFTRVTYKNPSRQEFETGMIDPKTQNPFRILILIDLDADENAVIDPFLAATLHSVGIEVRYFRAISFLKPSSPKEIAAPIFIPAKRDIFISDEEACVAEKNSAEICAKGKISRAVEKNFY